jgi:hypothetical protein
MIPVAECFTPVTRLMLVQRHPPGRNCCLCDDRPRSSPASLDTMDHIGSLRARITCCLRQPADLARTAACTWCLGTLVVIRDLDITLNVAGVPLKVTIGRAGKVGPENLDGLSHRAGTRLYFLKQAETCRQAEDRPATAGTVNGSTGPPSAIAPSRSLHWCSEPGEWGFRRQCNRRRLGSKSCMAS